VKPTIHGNGNTPPRPVALAPIPANIPARLKVRAQWVLWRYERQGDKWTKVPYQVSGAKARTNAPATWTTFDTVWAAYEAGGWDGIGYVLTADDGLVGVDVDHCGEHGHLDAQGRHWVQHFRSYSEASPSGALRIFIEASLAGLTGRKKGNTECYDRGRFLSVTGRRLDGASTTIAPRQGALEAFHALIWPLKPERPRPSTPARPVDLDDQELLAKARAAKNGAKFSRAYDGDSSDWRGDESRGDLYLAGELLWWTNGDRDRAMRLFEASGRVRAKWHESRGTQTYSARTFNVAEERFRGGYTPPTSAPVLAPVAPPSVNLTDAPPPQCPSQEPSDAARAGPCWHCPYTDRIAALEAQLAERDARIAQLTAANEHLRQRAAVMHATQLATMETLRDPRLKLAANTGVALAKEVASQVSRGAHEDGWVRVTLTPHPQAPGRSLAEQAGRSTRRTSADLEQFEQLGWLKRRYDSEKARRVDPATGEITQQAITVLRVKMEGADEGAPALLAKLRAKYDERDQKASEDATAPKPKQWGGARPRCPDHPHAALVERRELCCKECGKVLDFRQRPYHPGEVEDRPIGPTERPDTWPELTPAAIGQVDRSVSDADDGAEARGIVAARLPDTPIGQVDRWVSDAADSPPERGNHVTNSLPTCPTAPADAPPAQPRLLVVPPEPALPAEPADACHCIGACVCADGTTGPPPGALPALHGCVVPGCPGLTPRLRCPRHQEAWQRGEAS